MTDQLSRISVFSGLSNVDKESIAKAFATHSFGKGQVLISHGEVTTAVYFIISGNVRASMFSPSGREVSYQDLGPGEMFGELAAIDQLPRSTHVIGLGQGQLLSLDREQFNQLLARHPSISQAVLLKMSRMVRFLCDRLYEYATLSVAERLRAELVRLARLQDSPPGKPIVLCNMPTHEELANRLATHREAITRELGHLEKHGFVHKQRNKVTILDLRALESLNP